MKFFDYDGPLMSFLLKVSDLVCLNLLTIIFCIPIITAGASITAAHYVALKNYRYESNIFKNFWKAFKENLKQSTIIWMVFVLHFVIAMLALYVLPKIGGMLPTIVQGIIIVVFIVSVILYAWVFPLQSKFENKISTTFNIAFYLAFKHFFRTVYLIVLNLLPLMLVMILSLKWYSLWICFGFSVPIYWSAIAYNKVFEKMEEMILEREGK